jgi:SulP family sulfate permease
MSLGKTQEPPMANLSRFFPPLTWGRAYSRDDLRGDLQGGLTTAVMLIPQGMAYAMLAGLPPIVGLYASLVPLIVYALLGTSRQLAVGPVAMVSLLVASGVGALVEQGTDMYLAYAVMLMVMVGGLQLVMGLGRLGFLVNFLSHPVLSGFTSAAALIIGLSQLKHLLGVNIPRSHHVHEIVLNAVNQVGDINAITVGIGVASVVVLVVLKKVAPRFPRALAVVVGGTLAVWGLGLNDMGVKIVGDVPAGLPAMAVPSLDMGVMKELLPTALTIALVGFMESIAVARAFARRHKYEVDANQELVGLGAANLLGSLFGGYPVTGGFSRTAVNDQAGSKTPAAAIVTAVVIGLTLLFLTPLFHFLPKAVLAAIIMTAVFGLIDIAEVKHLWQVDRADLVLLTITFFATLGFGIEQGILAGVGASMLWFVVRSTRPHYAVLGRVGDAGVWRNVAREQDARPVEGVLAVRMDAPFYYGNVSFLKDTLKKLEADAVQKEGGPLRALVLDATAMNELDSSAAGAMVELCDDFCARGVPFYLAGVKGPVMDTLRKAHLVEKIGEDHLPLRVEDAVRHALGEEVPKHPLLAAS